MASKTCKPDLKTASAPLMLLQAITQGGMLTLGSPAPISTRQHTPRNTKPRTHRSTTSRHRARLCPGPETGLHCRAGLIQSGVQNVQTGFEDGWCISYAALGYHPRWHADSGQPCTNLNQAAHSK